MDEVFKALDESTETDPDSFDLPSENADVDISSASLAREVANEVEQMSRNTDEKKTCKKKQVAVKPISIHDQKHLDTAIAIVTDYAQKTIEGTLGEESPSTKKKFPLRLKASPRTERRNFSKEVASIKPDINKEVMMINDDAKLAYNLLVHKGPNENLPKQKASPPISKSKPQGLRLRSPSPDGAVPSRPTSGKPPVKPRYQNANVHSDFYVKSAEPMPSTRSEPLPAVPEIEDPECEQQKQVVGITGSVNVLPLPPRKKGALPLNLKRHQRKYPLLHLSMSVPDIPPKPLPRSSIRERSSSVGDELDSSDSCDTPERQNKCDDNRGRTCRQRSYSAEELGIYDNHDYFWSDKLELSPADEANIS